MFGAFERRVTLAAMNFPAKRWIESQPRAATRGSEHGAIHSRPLRESILEKMLKTRGISSEQRENFLHPATKNLAPARDMHGMVEAARLICAAVRAHRKIAIYGDYDVDGVMATAILMESALAFLSLSDPNVASWGNLIGQGRGVLRTQWYVSAIPGAAILLTVLAVSLVGQGLNDALNPRLKSR